MLRVSLPELQHWKKNLASCVNLDLSCACRKFRNNLVFFLFLSVSLQQLWLRVKDNLKALNLVFDPHLEGGGGGKGGLIYLGGCFGSFQM